MRILFMAANPLTTSSLDLEEELRSLEHELRGVKHRDRIKFVAQHASRPDDLLRHVRTEQPTVVHFSGHGSASGIMLQSDDGGHTEVSGSTLKRFLDDRGVKLLVLNACYTKAQAARVLRAVDAVVGTKDAIEDEAARRFTVAFYRALGDGLSIREAFRDGGDAVALHGFKDVFWSDGNLDYVPLAVTDRVADHEPCPSGEAFQEGAGGGMGELGPVLSTETATVDVEVTLRGKLSGFTAERRKAFLEGIVRILEADGEIRIKREREGSIKVTLELTPAQAERLKWAVERGELEELDVVGAEIVAPLTPSPVEQHRRRSRKQFSAGPDQGAAGATARKKPRRTLSREDEKLLAQLLTAEQDFIDSPVFREEGAEQSIYDEAPDIQKPDTSWYHPVMDDLSPGKSRTVKSAQQVILTGAEERVLFHQFNYARFRVWKLQQEVWSSPDRKPTPEQAEEMLGWYRRSEVIREQIAEANLALVLAMAKRTRMSEVDFADLVSEGNMALLRAVDKFDAGHGYKFSTYACRAILKAFSRQGMKLSKYRQRFPTDFDPKLEKGNYLKTKRAGFEKEAADEVKRIVLENRADLSDVERTVIEHRFGLESGEADKPMTLEQVGQMIGMNAGRVRQIQNKAMEKIRLALESSFLGVKKDEEAEGALAEGSLALQVEELREAVHQLEATFVSRLYALEARVRAVAELLEQPEVSREQVGSEIRHLQLTTANLIAALHTGPLAVGVGTLGSLTSLAELSLTAAESAIQRTRAGR